MESFGVGEEVALLGTALFMIALGLGSLISAPFSEILGRNPVCAQPFGFDAPVSRLTPHYRMAHTHLDWCAGGDIPPVRSRDISPSATQLESYIIAQGDW
ncbi:unnamed protein product [Aspergillus oryzae]|uniref:Unnamed protein product n=2 Tax=Aspergillus oryzae TaxID=5062 RepID=A0AAN4YW95_ASPOZ|nr:unnamed protein product [Aspergillus oryzae]GMG17320.1 unnamed protein product [Aspergillus oryzae]GMG38916.1 unnamed protein product [Aspergillus oryzae]